jgi:transposase InsO family protein
MCCGVFAACSRRASLRCFATLECELIDRSTFRSHDVAREAIFDFIEGFYNTRRRHSSIGYQSPVRFESRQAVVA